MNGNKDVIDTWKRYTSKTEISINICVSILSTLRVEQVKWGGGGGMGRVLVSVGDYDTMEGRIGLHTQKATKGDQTPPQYNSFLVSFSS